MLASLASVSPSQKKGSSTSPKLITRSMGIKIMANNLRLATISICDAHRIKWVIVSTHVVCKNRIISQNRRHLYDRLKRCIIGKPNLQSKYLFFLRSTTTAAVFQSNNVLQSPSRKRWKQLPFPNDASERNTATMHSS